jgi:hypothetical protein
MLRRVLMLSLAGLLAAPMTAAAQQSFTVSLGGFSPRGQETRDPNDVLLNNLDFLAFNISDLTGFSVGGEYLIALGDKFDAGVGVSYYRHSTLAVDRFSEFQGSGDPIVANLSLHQVPITATFRFLPLGHRGFVPYVGGGVGIIHYSYNENGDFVSSDNVTIISGDFSGDGWAAGRRRRSRGRAEIPGGDRQSPGEPGFRHRGARTHAADRSRRLDLLVHDQLQILTAATLERDPEKQPQNAQRSRRFLFDRKIRTLRCLRPPRLLSVGSQRAGHHGVRPWAGIDSVSTVVLPWARFASVSTVVLRRYSTMPAPSHTRA